MRRKRAIALVVVAATAVHGCRGRDDLDGTRRPLPGLKKPGAEYSIETPGQLVAWDFYDNRASAVTHANGRLVIECGSADFAKYAEGAYRSPWHLAVVDGTERTALVHGLAGELYLPLDADPGGIQRDSNGGLEVQFLARAAKKRQLVSVLLNEHRLGDVSMPSTERQSYAIRAPASAIRAGENKLRFYFGNAGTIAGQRSAAAFTRIALGARRPGEPTPALIAEDVTRGGKRMAALRTRGASRLSYFLQLPARDPTIAFVVAGANSDVSLQVAAASGGAAATLWQGHAAESWQNATVSLAEHGGEVVRIDFLSKGAVDWGRPQLLVRAEPARPVAADHYAPAAPAASADPARRLASHVILWAVASLRADRVAGTRVPTPAFARFCSQGIRFDAALSACPMPGPAHVALLTGRYPAGPRIGADAKTLAERFSDAGYTTALISGNGFVNDEAGFARGFDIYANPMRRRQRHGARILWQRARRVLSAHRDGHTFIYVATAEPHLPYTPTAESLAAVWDGPTTRIEPAKTARLSRAVREGKQHLTLDEREFIQALYDAEVRDASLAFGEMLADLETLRVADRTAVILVGDHGEELWERDSFGHGSHLYQEVLHVPLVIAAPGHLEGKRSAQDVQLIDVYSTALDLAGVAVNPEGQGRSLLPPRGDEAAPLLPSPAQAHLPGWGRTLKLGRYKLLVPLRGRHELYDLAADPGELHNLIGARPLVERYLRNVFGLAVAYQHVWSHRRWGAPNALKAAFAADQGL